ncbi:hypothetical protein OAA57_00030 [bacterium]|jgi:hypothetical protein|nr:hypothetical protein [bacterium]
MSTIQNTGGHLTYPNLPFIQLFHNSTTSYNAGVTISDWRVNASRSITESSGVITVPVAGLYEIHIGLICGTTGGIMLEIDGVEINRIGYAQAGTGEVWSQIGSTGIHQLNANSTVEFVSNTAGLQLHGAANTTAVGGANIRLIG